MAENPFTRPSRLPYWLPPFDRISNPDYRPAFEQAMREQRAEVRKIAQDRPSRISRTRWWPWSARGRC